MVMLFITTLFLIIGILFFLLLKESKDVTYHVIRFDKCKVFKLKSSSSPNFVSILNCNDELESFTIEGEKTVTTKKILSVSENIEVIDMSEKMKIFR